MVLRGQNADCADPRDVARGVVDPSPSLEGGASATGSMGRLVGLRGVTATKGEVRGRRVRCCSSLGVRLSVRVLPDELEVRADGGW